MELKHVSVEFEAGKNGVLRIEALAEGLVVTGLSGRRVVIPQHFGEKPAGGHAPVKKAAPAAPASPKPAPAKKAPAPKAKAKAAPKKA